MNEWISIQDKLPPNDKQLSYLIWDGDVMEVGLFPYKEGANYFLCGAFVNTHVKFWQKLPEPPKESGDLPQGE